MGDTFFINEKNLEPRDNTLYLQVSHDVANWCGHPLMMALPMEALDILAGIQREAQTHPGVHGLGGAWADFALQGELLLAIPFGGVKDRGYGESALREQLGDEWLAWAKAWKRRQAGISWGRYDGRPLFIVNQELGTCTKEVYVSADGLVTLRWISNVSKAFRFIKPALLRINDWPASALKRLDKVPIVHRTRRCSVAPYRPTMRMELLSLREGWVGVELTHLLPECTNAPIIAAVPEGLWWILATCDVSVLPNAVLLTVGRSPQNEMQWGNYGPLPLRRFADPIFRLQCAIVRGTGKECKLEWTNLNDLESGPCIISKTLKAER